MTILYELIFDRLCNNQIVVWKESRWIVLSSIMMTIPAIYGFYNKLYTLSVFICMTSFISANYWRNATFGIRRDVDLIFSKISFSIFVYNGFIHVYYFPSILLGHIGLISMIYLYYLSNKYFELRNTNWLSYHFLFHMTIIIEQMMILSSIVKKMYIENQIEL